MDMEELQNARSGYSYPPAHLTLEGNHLQFDRLKFAPPGNTDTITKSTQLDEYHRNLLHSESDQDIRLGIASVQYWGRAFAKGRSNHNQSSTRVGWLFHGNAKTKKTFFTETSINAVKSAILLSKKRDFSGAYWSIREIPHFGVSFGSKLLAFCDPENIGIYDSHISRYVTENSESIRSTFELDDSLSDFTLRSPDRFSKSDAYRFHNYCLALQSIASTMNKKGLMWRDWDESENLWRSVDAERAIFVIAQRKLSP